jgi:transcriptional regulator with XRE-family HTH domain
MRNAPEGSRNTWSTLISQVGKATGLTDAALARRLGVNRATVWRWKAGLQRPENPDTVATFARLLGIPVAEALVAAGLAPSGPARREPPTDPHLLALTRMLADPDVNDETKRYIRAQLELLTKLPPRARPAGRDRETG